MCAAVVRLVGAPGREVGTQLLNRSDVAGLELLSVNKPVNHQQQQAHHPQPPLHQAHPTPPVGLEPVGSGEYPSWQQQHPAPGLVGGQRKASNKGRKKGKGPRPMHSGYSHTEDEADQSNAAYSATEDEVRRPASPHNVPTTERATQTVS